ncbi:TIGR04283 family arsenosugar biosynthesis glycosyltransferase [bacterium]|nr:TIGR04283 family arsenosugar biosynthesis glycosyltransferase [bacterium]
MKSKLWIFSRYPVAGAAKTRLIPAIGPQRAADLQQAMIRRTLAWAEPLSRVQATSKFPIEIEVSLTGGSPAEFYSLFGTEIPCSPQSEGDLGQRMLAAFQRSSAAGPCPTVIVGTDAPYLDAALIQQAFDSLQRCDVVLGPAWDGGYYLIGLREPRSTLFEGIRWGTETVFEETLARVKSRDWSVAILSPLGDIDHPEDLPHWTKATRQPVGMTESATLSVIIPTWNEEKTIAKTIENIAHRSAIETIVVDGGSTDQTVSIARQAGAKTFLCRDGRGAQLNLGASVAAGESLLFLHADTILPDDFPERVHQHLSNSDVAGGAFSFGVDEPSSVPSMIRWGTNFRSRWLSLPFGDQALFCRASTFWTQGGFRPWPILEDVALIRDLSRMGRIVIDPAYAVTSARRWKQVGPWRTWWINQLVLAGYALGVSPDRLAHFYRNQTRR